MKEWVIFYYKDKEIAAITVYGLMYEEIPRTKELLAYERGVSPDEITTKIETRKG